MTYCCLAENNEKLMFQTYQMLQKHQSLFDHVWRQSSGDDRRSSHYLSSGLGLFICHIPPFSSLAVIFLTFVSIQMRPCHSCAFSIFLSLDSTGSPVRPILSTNLGEGGQQPHPGVYFHLISATLPAGCQLVSRR